MRKVITLAMLLLLTYCAHAQEIIVTKDGEKIQAKIIEVTASVVTYKKFSKPDGSTYSIAKTDVKSITYQDTKETPPETPIIIKHVSKGSNSLGSKTTGYVIFGGGTALALGEYASTTVSDRQSGFANVVGFNLHVDFAMPIAHSNFGVAASIGYNQHTINTSTFDDEEAAKYNGQYNFNLLVNPNQVTTIMGGLYVTIPVKKFAFDFKALVGVTILSIAQQTETVTDITTYQSETATISAINQAAFAYGGNFTVRFNAAKHFCIYAQVGIVHSENDYTATATYNDGAAPEDKSVEQPVTILTSTVGIGFPF